MNQINFICFNASYPIDLEIFNRHSDFFSNRVNEIRKNVDLLNEFDFCPYHTPNSIEAFLNYCQDRPMELTVDNVISIEALSKKYNVEQLQQEAKEFIENNFNEVINYLFTRIDARTPIFDDLLSRYIIKHSDEDHLYTLPISTLYRVQHKILNRLKLEEANPESDQVKILSRTIVNFLIKTVYTKNDDSEIFISSNKFNQEQIRYLIKKINTIGDYKTKEILTQFLQSNPSYVIEYQKNEERIRKKMDDKVSLLLCNLDLEKPINLPNSPTKIYRKQFKQFPFTKVILPDNIEVIEDEAFKDCSTLKEIKIPETVTTIGDRTFSGCSSLKEVTIPETVTTIGENIFEGCKELIISKDMKKIPDNLFNGCTSITKITISNSVTAIGERSFNGCSKLKEIIIPASVTKICERSFSGCTSLKEITIPVSVTIFGENIFEGCDNLTQISIDLCRQDSSEIVLWNKAVDNNSNENENETIFDKMNIDESFFNDQDLDVQICIVNLIKQVEQFEDDDFENIGRICKVFKYLKEVESQAEKEANDKKYICFDKQDIYINWAMTSILYSNGTFNTNDFYSKMNVFRKAFYEIEYPTDDFKDIFNKITREERNQVVYLFNDLEAIKLKLNENIKIVKINTNVTTIISDAFKGCSSLEKILFESPSSVTSIEKGAFSGCYSLMQLSIPSTVKSIGTSSFYRCSSLTQLIIPPSVTSIENYTFFGCSSLKQITIPSSVTSIGDNAFEGCSSLEIMLFENPSSLTSIGSSACQKCTSLKQLTIPPSVKSIGSFAFEGCSSLKQASIPSSVTNVGDMSFFGCSSLEEIKVPIMVNVRDLGIGFRVHVERI